MVKKEKISYLEKRVKVNHLDGSFSKGFVVDFGGTIFKTEWLRIQIDGNDIIYRDINLDHVLYITIYS